HKVINYFKPAFIAVPGGTFDDAIFSVDPNGREEVAALANIQSKTTHIFALSARCALRRHLAGDLPFRWNSDAEDIERVLARACIGEIEAVGVDGDEARQFVGIGGD